MVTFPKLKKKSKNPQTLVKTARKDARKQGQALVKTHGFINSRKPIRVCVLQNTNHNQIEKRLAQSLVALFENKTTREQGVVPTQDISKADVVVFMLSENVPKVINDALHRLRPEVVKIALFASPSQLKFNMNDIQNLIVVTQNVDSEYGKKQLKKILKLNNAKITKEPLSVLINIVRDADASNVHSVKYDKFLFNFGFYEMMAAALPKTYSNMEIVCDSVDDATQMRERLIYTRKTDSSTIGNKVFIDVTNHTDTEFDALVYYAQSQLIKLMRDCVEFAKFNHKVGKVVKELE